MLEEHRTKETNCILRLIQRFNLFESLFQAAKHGGFTYY